VKSRITGGADAEQVQRCRGAEGQRCRGSEMQRCRETGAEVQRCRGAGAEIMVKVQRCADLTQASIGTKNN